MCCSKLAKPAGVDVAHRLRRRRLPAPDRRAASRRPDRRRHARPRPRPPAAAHPQARRASIVLVLDEADQMLDKGFAPGRRAHHQHHAAGPPDGALLGDDARLGEARLAPSTCNEPETIAIGTETEAEPDIEHSDHRGLGRRQDATSSSSLLDEPTEGATLVFGRTRHGVINLARRLQQARLRGRSAAGRPRPARARPHRQALP